MYLMPNCSQTGFQHCHPAKRSTNVFREGSVSLIAAARNCCISRTYPTDKGQANGNTARHPKITRELVKMKCIMGQATSDLKAIYEIKELTKRALRIVKDAVEESGLVKQSPEFRQSDPSKQHRDPLLGYHCATSHPMDRAVVWVLVRQATQYSGPRYKTKGSRPVCATRLYIV